MNEHHIETRQLRHLLMLARHRNFHRAAEALFITQPALTKSIRNLESQLEVNLFDRKTHSVDPTPQGEVLLEHARRVLQELEDARHSLDAMSSELSGQVRVGSGPVVAQGLVSDAVAKLLSAHPGVSVKIIIVNWHELADLLREGKLHLFVADIEELEEQADLKVIQLANVPVVYACRPGHPLAAKGRIEPADLLDYPLAVPSLPRRYQSWLRDHAPRGIDADAFLDRACRVSCEDVSVLQRMAQESDMLTGGPRSRFADTFTTGVLVELAFDGLSEMNVMPGLVYLRDTTLPPVARMLIDSLLDQREHTAGDR